MESLVFNPGSKNQIIEHRDNSCHVKYEYGIIAELLAAIDQNDQETLNWFGSFGGSLRAIIMNLYAYRKDWNLVLLKLDLANMAGLNTPYGWTRKI